MFMRTALASIACSGRNKKAIIIASLIVPTITFTSGVGSSHDLTQYVSGWDSGTMELILQGTALPTGVTFNGTHLVYDGTPGTTTVNGVILVVIML